MTGVRLHDRYVLRAYLAALVTALLFLSSLFVLYDLAERVDKLPKAMTSLAKVGRGATAVLVEYYLTLLPFLWLRLLPIASLAGAGVTFTWLARQNELVPLVASGVPTRRVLVPVFATAVVLMAAHTIVREYAVPTLSRRHDDLHRLLQEPGRQDRFQEVPHVGDALGGRLSMAAYYPGERRMEGVWIVFRRDPRAQGRHVGYRYPSLRWDDAAGRWLADRGGQRRVFAPLDGAVDAETLPTGAAAPLALEPALLELTLRQGAAMGLSSGEIAALARANPDKARFTLLLHQQWASPLPVLVLLMLGLPMVFHLGRGRVFRSFAATLALVAAYYLVDSTVTDMGARGAINPIVAAWAAHVVFGALGVVLMGTIET